MDAWWRKGLEEPLNLFGADLRGTRLQHTLLAGAQFAQAFFGFTVIADCDLSVALGLEAVVHDGPSTIGVYTLVRSFRGAGNQLTPQLQTFFINAGVPEGVLSELPGSLAGVRYYRALLCYDEPDKAFAERLVSDLRGNGVSCWICSMDATPGARTWEEIGQKRRELEKMIVLCTAQALVRDGVLREIEEQIDEQPNKLVPASLDDLWKAKGSKSCEATET
ncbi:MAG: TIR domain-containing protein [Dehalococcoidia bacterium]|nr:TIR domain-containing protein [Dehalococcoidia bacterium]